MITKCLLCLSQVAYSFDSRSPETTTCCCMEKNKEFKLWFPSFFIPFVWSCCVAMVLKGSWIFLMMLKACKTTDSFKLCYETHYHLMSLIGAMFLSIVWCNAKKQQRFNSWTQREALSCIIKLSLKFGMNTLGI